MEIKIQPAQKEDLAICRNLVRYYVYDISEWMGWDCTEQGIYDGCDELPEYWEKPNHWPFVLRVENHLAGFAMVKRQEENSEPLYDMGEFFIIRKFRGKGLGRQAAHFLFNEFRGKWHVRELLGNKPAIAFWRSVISAYTDGQYEETLEEHADPYSGKWSMLFQRFTS